MRLSATRHRNSPRTITFSLPTRATEVRQYEACLVGGQRPIRWLGYQRVQCGIKAELLQLFLCPSYPSLIDKFRLVSLHNPLALPFRALHYNTDIPTAVYKRRWDDMHRCGALAVHNLLAGPQIDESLCKRPLVQR